MQQRHVPEKIPAFTNMFAKFNIKSKSIQIKQIKSKQIWTNQIKTNKENELGSLSAGKEQDSASLAKAAGQGGQPSQYLCILH